MKTTPKESPEVIEARRRVEYFGYRIEETRKSLEELGGAYREALKELGIALFKADEHLPQATLWQSCRLNRDSVIGKVVILRQTPSGQIICRLAGSSNAIEMRFKPSKHEWDNKFYTTEKRDYRGGYKYLLDVPEEYTKAARKQNT